MRETDGQGEEIAAIGEAVADQLHTEVAAMNLDNFLVRPQRQYVERYGGYALPTHCGGLHPAGGRGGAVPYPDGDCEAAT